MTGPSILDRYFLRELTQTVAATAIVLVVIFAGSTFAHVLQQVANGSYPASVMFQVLGLNMLDGLSNLLPLAGFLGILQGLGRMYRESEMHVLASSGMGPQGLLRPVSVLAGVICILVAVVSLWLGPWAARTSDAIVAAANRSVIAAGLDAGRFAELPGSNPGIIFVDALSRDGSQLGNTFIATDRTNHDGTRYVKVVTGKNGHLYQESNGSDRFLAINDGWQYEIPLGADNWRKMKYERNDASLSNIQSDDDSEDPAHSLTLAALVRTNTPDARAEFAWRITVPAMALVLFMLSLPLSRQSPREPRYGRLMLAGVTFFLYFQVLAICRGQIAKGRWHNSASLWLVSIVVFALAAWMFRRQYAPRRVVVRSAA